MTLRVFEAFSGIGTQRMALRNLGIEHEVVAISEIDKFAIQTYQAIHGETNNLGDISKIDANDIPDHDLFTYSFPCFTGDTLVLTSEGYKRIDEIQIGDMVLTHKNRFKKVVNVFNQGVKDVVTLSGDNFNSMRVTLNHKFWARKYNNETQDFLSENWHELQSLSQYDLLALAIQDNENSYKHTWVDFNITNNSEQAVVYDIEVEEDHSFTANNIVVHNCTDISVAGLQKGLSEDSGTRSSLLWECRRVIENKKPKYLLMENVKNLVGKKFKADFDKWLDYLESLGYTNYWQVLNAKDYGVPQNRERVFCVSILGEHEPYKFPEKQKLTIRLKDVLEESVDEKFYLSKEIQDRLTIDINFNNEIKKIGTTAPEFRTIGQRDIVYSDEGIMSTLTATDYKQPKQIGEEVKAEPTLKQVIRYDTPTRENSSRFRGYDTDGIAPSLTTMQGGGLQPHIVDDIYNNRPPRYYDEYSPSLRAERHGLKVVEEDVDNKVTLEPKEEFGRMGKQAVETANENNVQHGDTINPFNKSISSNDGVSPTLTTRPEGFNTAISVVEEKQSLNYRVRKLTPKECWRLMGCSDEDFHKAESVNSNSQLYKQAGNAIVVDVLEGIFRNLFIN